MDDVEHAEPARPLGPAGSALWAAALDAGGEPGEELLQLCEQVDERVGLRIRVLRDGDPDDRRALRDLEGKVAHSLRRVGLDRSQAHVQRALDADLEDLPPEQVVGRATLVAASRAIALGLDSSTAAGDHHASVFLVRELRALHGVLTGGAVGPDPFEEFLVRMSSPVGDTPQP